MRHGLATTAVLALLTAGCSGSTKGSSTTGAIGILPPGTSCGSNASCASGSCGTDGTGSCCAAACDSGDPACGATGCSDAGACLYPAAATVCRADSCGQGKLTRSACDGAGSCNPGTPTACAGNLACNPAGTECLTSCSANSDCLGGLVCDFGACIAPIAVGACSEDDDCTSGLCGISGTGHCCSAACGTGDPLCGVASDCDGTTGACLYPDSTVTCIPGACVDGDQRTEGFCDGKGNCADAGTAACDQFLCGPSACLSSCSDSSSCVAGAFCDVLNASCCGSLTAGATLAVDSLHGSDSTACCGAAANPCQTLTHALALIDSAQVQNVTLLATVGSDGGNWLPPGEVYPVTLGWGVELSAPGVYFVDIVDGGGKRETFDIAPVSKHDTVGYASVVGTSSEPVTIGVNDPRTFGERTLSIDTSSIRVESGNTLYIANANVHSSFQVVDGTTAITVAGSGALRIGQDQSGSVKGTLTIGTLDTGFSEASGIVCESLAGLGCAISDAALVGTSSLVIMGQQLVDIRTGDGAVVSLTSSPVIGATPSAPGFGNCPSKRDATGTAVNPIGSAVMLIGSTSMTFSNGAVQCIGGDGFELLPSGDGEPLLTLDGTTIQNVNRGVYAVVGKAAIANSTIWYNFVGVEQDGFLASASTIDLSGGTQGGTNTVACAGSTEKNISMVATRAVAVLNTTAATLNASNVSWDTPGPDLFACDPTLTDCSCQIASCTAGVDAGALDAVYEPGGAITTTGNQLSPAICGTVCGSQVCPDGFQCCDSFSGGLGCFQPFDCGF